MRLWTIHPHYLDAKGIVALWREGLLAQKCLAGLTKGYTHHPQLNRFKTCADPMGTIGYYLNEVVKEATRRNYTFDHTKIMVLGTPTPIPTTTGQLQYEWQHFLKKVQQRDPSRYQTFHTETSPTPHPLFTLIEGDIEPWEIV